ncbi:NodB homology domain containing protein [Mycobacteriaceae bacterium]
MAGARGADSRFCDARLFVILDDASIGQRAALYAAEQRGQLLNLAVCTDFITKGGGVKHLSWPDIKNAARRGHGLLAHSKTHRWLTALGDAEVEEEFDYSQAAVSKAAGVRVLDFVYPSSKHDLRTDAAAAGRFRRVFAGRWEGNQWRYKVWSRKPFVCGRWGWASSNHAETLDQIRAAASAQEDIVIYTHATDGSNWHTEGVTAPEFNEVLELALQLGMRVARIDEFDSVPRSV